MKHKSFIRLSVCLLGCLAAASTGWAESDETASTVGAEQAIASKSAGDSAARSGEASGKHTLVTLEPGSPRLVISSPLQDPPVANSMYAQTDNAPYNSAPEPPVALLVLIGFLGLIIGRRRLR